MPTRKSYFWVKAISKRLIVLALGVIVMFGFSQTAALANSISPQIELTPYPALAIAASSRFAAQAESKDAEPIIPEDKLDELREQRRQWQNQGSTAAAIEAEQTTKADTSLGEVVKDKLNLDEIVEENEIVEELKGSK